MAIILLATLARGPSAAAAMTCPSVNITSDANNCGSCGHQCDLAHATALCLNGSCVIASCNIGYSDCNGHAEDGCETSGSTCLPVAF